MNEIIVSLSLICMTTIGMLTAETFNLLQGFSRFSKIPYWFGLGLGILSFELFLFSLFSIKWDLLFILGPWVFVSVLFLYKKKINFNVNFEIMHTTIYEKLLLIGIVALLLFVGFESVLRPLSAFDGWAIWVLKARMFYIDGFINPNAYHILKENYPYVINLGLVFLMKTLGRLDDRSILLLFYSFYLLSAVAIFTSLRTYTTRLISLIFTFLFVSTQNVIRHGGRYEAGYADLALGFYILLTIVLLLNFFKKWGIRNLVMVECMLVVSSLVKEEGLLFSLIVNLIVVLFILHKRKFGLLLTLLIYIIPLLLWQYFKIQNNLSYSLYMPIVFHSGRYSAIVKEIIREMLNIKNWNFLWISFLFSLFLSIYLKNKYIFIVLSLILIQFLAYFIIFTFSPHEPSQHIPSVMNRLLLHVAPASILFIALVFNKTVLRR